MPERLDRVTVALKRGDLAFSWDARQALLTRLYNANIKAGMMTWGASTDDILRAFEAVGSAGATSTSSVAAGESRRPSARRAAPDG